MRKHDYSLKRIWLNASLSLVILHSTKQHLCEIIEPNVYVRFPVNYVSFPYSPIDKKLNFPFPNKIKW